MAEGTGASHLPKIASRIFRLAAGVAVVSGRDRPARSWLASASDPIDVDPARGHVAAHAVCSPLGRRVRPTRSTARRTCSRPTEAERAAIAALCAARGVAVLVDEVFHDYPLDLPLAPPSVLAREPAALTFALSGLSKIAALPQL